MGRFRLTAVAAVLIVSVSATAHATVFGDVRGVIHDATHRPVGDADIELRSEATGFAQTGRSAANGEFQFTAVPVGDYRIAVRREGFEAVETALLVNSGSAPVVHLQLVVSRRTDSVTVQDRGDAVETGSSTPVTTVSRREIANTPGADLSNSLSMITDYVPGAYVTHDQLHLRGGHQVTWAIDGIPIPNTNIASNVGPQIDPKDIDYLEVDRGGYSAENGDRTYGVFNVVPRTGFERTKEAELSTTYGSFQQTNNQINFGSHSDRLAYYASVNGNRSDYGLETPGPEVEHDRDWGLGGFGSLIFNKSPSTQLRFVATLRRDDYQVPVDAVGGDPSARDLERERDGLAAFTWARTFRPGVLFTISPFFHQNVANYDGSNNGDSISTIQHRTSLYAGAQIALSVVTGNHNARAGGYGFGQRDDESVRLTARDGFAAASKIATGHLEAGFLEDQWKAMPWLTLAGGVRMTRFSGGVRESAANPRAGAAVRIPHLNWTLHGSFSTYYQAPPLSTVSGGLLDFAANQGLGILPLHGERDQENQAGLTIPFRGWSLDVNSFRLRATNYFDHNSIGDSNAFFPLTVAGARIRGWEATVRSPRIYHRGEVYLAYSHQHAEAEGAVTGGLTNFSPPRNGYFLLDHDQRETLHAGFSTSLPKGSFASGNLYYGSGFSDGGRPGFHLEPHTTFDLSVGKSFGENLSISATALNLLNRRFLLDNSPTFGGTHYADPRQLFVQVRYRFRY